MKIFSNSGNDLCGVVAGGETRRTSQKQYKLKTACKGVRYAPRRGLQRLTSIAAPTNNNCQVQWYDATLKNEREYSTNVHDAGPISQIGKIIKIRTK